MNDKIKDLLRNDLGFTFQYSTEERCHIFKNKNITITFDDWYESEITK